MRAIEWKSIIGHNDTVIQLRTLLRRDKMPHALLFLGPEGVGKFLVAEVTAAALFCNEADDPCGICQSCLAFRSGMHPDFLLVEPDGQSLKIEQIRQMQKDVAFAPYSANHRVVVLSHADKMTLPAANSLLKILEEPQGNVVFILIASQRQMLLDTILSRCMNFVFRPLLADVLQVALVDRGIADEDAAVLARLAQGSFGEALRIQNGGGLELREQAIAVLLCARSPMTKVWQLSVALGDMDRVKLSEVWRYLNFLLRDMLVLYADEDSTAIYNVDLREQLISMAKSWSKRRILLIIEESFVIEKMLNANVNTRLAAEKFLLRLRELSVD